MTKRDSFLLRLNPATMDAIRRWADDEFRSMNSQIEMVLQRALRDAGRLSVNTPQASDETSRDSDDQSEETAPTP